MTDERQEPKEPEAAGADAAEADLSGEELAALEDKPALSALLKRSLAADEVAAPERDLLTSVQGKLRKRSRGKFYGDGWSTQASRLNYALVATLMLVTILAIYVALGPTGFSLR